MKKMVARKETKKRKVMEPTAHEGPMKKWTLAREIKADKSQKSEQHGSTKTKKKLKLAERPSDEKEMDGGIEIN
jgi:hypothetical protein